MLRIATDEENGKARWLYAYFEYYVSGGITATSEEGPKADKGAK